MSDAVVKVTLLVVDDSLTSCIVLTKQLQKLGYEVDTAHSGQEALDQLNGKSYQLMLLDCFMPEMDGFEVTRRIREQEARTATHLPIIGISAETDIGHKKMCLMQGMDGVLEKPIDSDALDKVIQLWCPVASEQTQPVKAERIDKETLQQLFNETTKEDLQVLAHYIAANDRTGAQRIVHRIKGAALTLGQHDIAEQTTQLEKLFQECTTEVHVYQHIVHKIEHLLHK